MYIQSTRPSRPPSPKPSSPKPPSAQVPAPISKPRSALSATNRLLKAAEGFQLFENPIPGAVQDTSAVLGAGFAAFNIGAELYDRDWMGALEDTSRGAVSLIGGVKLLGPSDLAVDALSWTGAALNSAFAARDLSQKKYFEAGIKLATAAGLGMTAVGGPVAGPLGLAVLGGSGLCDLTRDAVRALKKE